MVLLEDLPNEVQNALAKFVDRVTKEFDVVGVLLVGSYTRGYAGENSDIDVYVVTEDQDWRERGNTWIDGYEIEYFANPPRQVRHYIQNEDRMVPHTADMLAHSIPVYGDDPVISELVAMAKEAIADQPPLERVELELLRYSVDDLRKDIMDLSGDPASYAYQQTLWNGVSRCNKAVFRHHRSIASRIKIRMEQLAGLDPGYTDLLAKVVDQPREYGHFIALVDYVEVLIGSRPKEWKLRSALTV